MKSRPQTKHPISLEFSAGGIVFRRDVYGVEIAFLLDPYHKWTFAKGHIERKEKIADAAIREVKEEMGIGKLRIIASLGRIDWWFKERRVQAHSRKGALVHKFTYYFLMEAPAGTKLRAQKSELIKAVRWMPIDQALKFSSYKDVRPVLQKAVGMLQRMNEKAL